MGPGTLTITGIITRLRRGLPRAAALAVLMIAAAPTAAGATFPGRDGAIGWSYSYAANEGPTPGGYGIRTIPGHGGRAVVLRSCATFGYCEAWTHVAYSADGRRLAWVIQTRHGVSDVIAAGADGTHPVLVGRGFGESFLPSGRRLVFVRGSGGHEQIVTSALTGTGLRVLAHVSDAADPQVSPDGRQILYASHTSVWAMSASGHGAHRLITGAKAPSWAPSGQAIVYIGFRSGRIFIAPPDGRQPRELPADGLCYPPACGGGSSVAVFSPDGHTVAFDDIDASGDPNVYTMPASGGRARRVDSIYTDSAGGAVTGLSWQPLR